MRILVFLGTFFLNIIYWFHKLTPVKYQISILSRQSDIPSMDIDLIKEALEKRTERPELNVLCQQMKPGLIGTINYLFHIVGPQMHALATSKVVLLDGYCIAASLLHHRDDLIIIQMWHAMGALKKFGRSILDSPEGRTSQIATAMNMHQGYDYFFVSSDECKEYFAEAYGCEEDKGVVMPLPRVDYLTDRDRLEKQRHLILEKIPQYKWKINILCAPTWRRINDMEERWKTLQAVVDPNRYNLIFTPHPVTRSIEVEDSNDYFNTLQLMSIADMVVTDYSAVLFEAAVAGIQTYLYIDPKDEYRTKRGFYIDFERDIPLPHVSTPMELLNQIEKNEYNYEALHTFASRFVKETKHATDAIIDFIEEKMI